MLIELLSNLKGAGLDTVELQNEIGGDEIRAIASAASKGGNIPLIKPKKFVETEFKAFDQDLNRYVSRIAYKRCCSS